MSFTVKLAPDLSPERNQYSSYTSEAYNLPFATGEHSDLAIQDGLHPNPSAMARGATSLITQVHLSHRELERYEEK